MKKFDNAKDLVDYTLKYKNDNEDNVSIISHCNIIQEIIKVLFGEYNLDVDYIIFSNNIVYELDDNFDIKDSYDNDYVVTINDDYTITVDMLCNSLLDNNTHYIIDGDLNCSLLLSNDNLDYEVFDIGDDFEYEYGIKESEYNYKSIF